MATVSFDIPKSPWEEEREKLKRQAEQLQMERLYRMRLGDNTGDMVGKWFVPKAWTEGLADVVSSYLGTKREKELEEKYKKSREEEQRSLIEDVQRYFDLLTPKASIPEETKRIRGPLKEVYPAPQTAAYNPGSGETMPGNFMRPVIKAEELQPVRGTGPLDATNRDDAELSDQARYAMDVRWGRLHNGYNAPPMGGIVAMPDKVKGSYSLPVLQADTIPGFRVGMAEGLGSPPTQAPSVGSMPAPFMPEGDLRPRLEPTYYDVQLPGVPGRPADPRAALVMALSSQHPLLRKLALDNMLATTEGSVGMKDWLKLIPYATPESLVAAGAPQEIGRITHRPSWSTVEGALFNKNATVPELSSATQGRYTDKIIRGDLYNQDTATGKITKADNAPNITAIGNAAESSYAKERGSAKAKDVTEAVASGRAAQAMLINLDYLDKLNEKTSVQGPLSDFSIAVSGLASSLGLPVDTTRLATDQTYRSIVNKQIVDFFTNAKGGAHGFTEMETKLLAQSFPQIDMNPQARKQVIDIMRAKFLRDIAVAENALRAESAAFPELGKIPNVTGTVPGPVQTRPGLNTPLTPEERAELEEYRKGRKPR